MPTVIDLYGNPKTLTMEEVENARQDISLMRRLMQAAIPKLLKDHGPMTFEAIANHFQMHPERHSDFCNDVLAALVKRGRISREGNTYRCK